jgi:hypothetical protein
MGSVVDDVNRCASAAGSVPRQQARVYCVRPSLLDPTLPSEPSFAPCRCLSQVVVLYLLNRPVAIIPATSLDQTSLDRWLDCLRARAPRRHAG